MDIKNSNRNGNRKTNRSIVTMRIVQTRRISQSFFFLLFLWFCVVSTPGSRFYQLDGWVVNWFLQLDPLVAVGTMLSTHTLYRGLFWGLVTIILTIFFGRFFCGWVCPFGSLHHFFSHIIHGRATMKDRIRLNGYRPWQRLKYIILIVFLVMAAFPSRAGILFSGLLDPLPLISRTVNLALLPMLDSHVGLTAINQRWYETGWLILAVFFLFLLLNLIVPRFFCRFICPTGALFGLVSRLAIYRIGKETTDCSDCKQCEQHCEGGCSPSTNIYTSECLLCCNCIDPCKDEIIDYRSAPFPEQHKPAPDLSRRAFILSLLTGAAAAPALALSNRIGPNYDAGLIRPPGSLGENDFLKRCIRCDQCIRVCPTNVLQAAGFQFGLEGLWTPRLNNRIGSSGCQLNCVACSLICPTAAIRPISLAEKLGKENFSDRGPIKIGTAFFDRGRCLPWAINKPCIVCEENCPVSPKAIFTREVFETVRHGHIGVKEQYDDIIELLETRLQPGQYDSGDYFCRIDSKRYKIIDNDQSTITVVGLANHKEVVREITIQIRLQQPYMDMEKCIGCGVCEHECPVSGIKAIRITAEGETRSKEKIILLNTL